MTRPRRRIAWGAGTGFFVLVSAMILLGPEGEDWRHVSGNFGERTDRYGALRYLTVTRSPVTAMGAPGPGYSVTRDLRGMGVAQTLMCLVAIGGAMRLIYRAGVSRKLPPDRCDECGYDVRGITTGRCPECGSPVEPPEA